MNKFKNCANFIVTILLICSILITMLSGFIRFSLTNKDVYMNLLETTNTYAAVTDSLYKKMSSILGNDISEDLKKSIITEEDVKKEADIVMNCMINNLISGQTIAPEIDTDVYKERIAEALKSLTGYDSYIISRKELTSSNIAGQYTIQPMNLITSNESDIVYINLNIDNSNKFNNGLVFENLASRSELEAQGRAMLREKGMTEAQARAKLAEKGISEEQVWQYLRDNGYLDSEESGTNESLDSSTDAEKVPDIDVNSSNKAEVETQTNSEGTERLQEGTLQSQDIDDSKISKSKIQNIVMSIILEQNTSFEEKMDKLYSQLMKEAEIIINKEMDSLNLAKLINSNVFKVLVRTTSILYKSFYISLVSIIFLIMILVIINNFDFTKAFNCFAKSLLISGIMSLGVFGLVYVSKVYVNFSEIFSKQYLQTIYLSASEYFCRILVIASAGIFICGLIMSIFIIQKRVSRR